MTDFAQFRLTRDRSDFNLWYAHPGTLSAETVNGVIDNLDSFLHMPRDVNVFNSSRGNWQKKDARTTLFTYQGQPFVRIHYDEIPELDTSFALEFDKALRLDHSFPQTPYYFLQVWRDYFVNPDEVTANFRAWEQKRIPDFTRFVHEGIDWPPRP